MRSSKGFGVGTLCASVVAQRGTSLRNMHHKVTQIIIKSRTGVHIEKWTAGCRSTNTQGIAHAWNRPWLHVVALLQPAPIRFLVKFMATVHFG